jgi:hypothetical protein
MVTSAHFTKAFFPVLQALEGHEQRTVEAGLHYFDVLRAQVGDVLFLQGTVVKGTSEHEGAALLTWRVSTAACGHTGISSAGRRMLERPKHTHRRYLAESGSESWSKLPNLPLALGMDTELPCTAVAAENTPHLHEIR